MVFIDHPHLAAHTTLDHISKETAAMFHPTVQATLNLAFIAIKMFVINIGEI